METVAQRRCCGCGETYPLTVEFFHRSQAQPGGLEYRCKACERQRARWRNMLRLYGLTPESYRALLDAQGGVCAVCKMSPKGGITSIIAGDQMFDVDHDHGGGHVRGLLCRGCNLILGNANDDPDHLRALADYLERNARP